MVMHEWPYVRYSFFLKLDVNRLLPHLRPNNFLFRPFLYFISRVCLFACLLFYTETVLRRPPYGCVFAFVRVFGFFILLLYSCLMLEVTTIFTTLAVPRHFVNLTDDALPTNLFWMIDPLNHQPFKGAIDNLLPLLSYPSTTRSFVVSNFLSRSMSAKGIWRVFNFTELGTCRTNFPFCLFSFRRSLFWDSFKKSFVF
jgi:hypothetical protein